MESLRAVVSAVVEGSHALAIALGLPPYGPLLASCLAVGVVGNARSAWDWAIVPSRCCGTKAGDDGEY